MNKRHSFECYTWHHGPMLPVRLTLNVQMIERPASFRTSSVYSVMGCTVNRFASLRKFTCSPEQFKVTGPRGTNFYIPLKGYNYF